MHRILIALVLFFDCVFGSDVLGDEEVLLVVLAGLVLRLRSSLVYSILLVRRHESHLLMVWGREHLFVLGLLGQLGREYLALDVAVRLDVRNG